MTTLLIYLESVQSKNIYIYEDREIVSRDKSSLNSDLLNPSTVSNSLKSSFTQFSVVSSKGILGILVNT